LRLLTLEEIDSKAQPAQVYERTPSALLRGYFSSIWSVKTPPTTGRRFAIVPDGCAELVWVMGRPCIVGPGRVPELERGGSCLTAIGFRFNLGAAPAWLGASANELVGLRETLDVVDAKLADRLMQTVGDAVDPPTIAARIESTLCALPRPRENTSAGAVLDYLRRAPLTEESLVRDLRSLFDVSERSVRRQTERLFGFGPKTLERILRMQRFIQLTRTPKQAQLAVLAAMAGFSDQAHLTREARELTGLTPKAILHSNKFRVVSRHSEA
jgi:AraC-like DNA-binding protein